MSNISSFRTPAQLQRLSKLQERCLPDAIDLLKIIVRAGKTAGAPLWSKLTVISSYPEALDMGRSCMIRMKFLSDTGCRENFSSKDLPTCRYGH